MSVNHFLLGMMLCFSISGYAQEKIGVLDFHLDHDDLTAMQQGTTVYDQNGERCALIKIYTQETGFTFDVGSLGYGNAKVVGIPAFTYYNYENGTIARGLQMAFSFKSGVRKAFVEDVVFTFDEHKKISNIAFGLGSTAENDILYRGAWDENTRKAIMNFLENYKTAYALKRLDYIRSIFDDDAVIIIGNVVKKASSRAINAGKESSSSTFSPKGNNIIRYNRYTKDAYLRNLEHCFDSNEFINLRFSNNEVRKMAKGGELYAIQIQQDYYSSTYNDQGYLFLEVDINNPQQPSIILRTWQPEKDPSFGLYGPGDF